MEDNWEDKLQMYLLACGTTGTTFKVLAKRFNYISEEMLNRELMALWAEKKAQRFTLSKNTAVWRATQKLNE